MKLPVCASVDRSAPKNNVQKTSDVRLQNVKNAENQAGAENELCVGDI